MKKFNELFEFVDKAVRSRKYPTNTGSGLKAALRLFEEELNEEEKNSLDKFRLNIEQIAQSVFAKKKDFTAASLSTYKSRVLKVLNDYEKYGVDPVKMANWQTKLIARQKKVSKKSASQSQENEENGASNSGEIPFVLNDSHRIELALRPGAKVIIIAPRDIKKSEIEVVKSILSSLCEENS